VQLSFALLLCLIDLKAEQKERDDRVVMHASRPMSARHRTPRFVVAVSDKVPESVDPMCAFWATPTNDFDLQTRLRIDEPQVSGEHGRALAGGL
jgi:hypothetical protein